MAGNLTTRYLFKTYSGIESAGTALDARIDLLIDEVCQLVSARCDREFQLTTYRTWQDGNGSHRLPLREWPITNIYRVSICSEDAIRQITYSGTGTHADVSFDGTNLTLHWIDGAGAEQTTNLAISTYATVTALNDAINAVTDWSTSGIVTDQANTASSFIRHVTGLWAKNPDCVDLRVPDDGASVRVVSGTNRYIEPEGGAGISGGLNRGFYGEDGGDHVFQHGGPGSGFAPASTGGAYGMQGFSCFPVGAANVFAWYKAGYTFPVDNASHTKLDTAGNVPKGLTLTMNRILKSVLDYTDEDDNMRIEKEGDYRYERAQVTSAVERHWDDLQEWARITQEV